MVRKRLLLFAAAAALCLGSGCMNLSERPFFQRLRGCRPDCCCTEGCPCCDECPCCAGGCPCCDGPVLGNGGVLPVPPGGDTLPMPAPLVPQPGVPPLTSPPRLVPEPQAQPMPAAPSARIR